jgi:ATPase subunit of ABC transporter with duplicated ATPase domains
MATADGPERLECAPGRPDPPALIQLRQLTLARGARRLVEGADLQLHAGWRVGVVGANGSGKSSLFALLLGELHAEAGDCVVPRDWRVAAVSQETPPLPEPAVEFVLDGDTELRETERAIAAAAQAHDGHRLAEAHARFEAIDGYAARARAATMLGGLGFAPSDLERPVADFSGGWRMRLNLGRALLSRADLLLLDEPTNHLDLDAVVWLERWLAAYRGTLLVVSHDRAFLDNVVTSTLVAEGDGRWGEYVGGYGDWLRQTRPAPAPAARAGAKPVRAAKAAPAPADAPRRATFKERKELADLPGRIEKLEAEKDALFERMGAPDFYRSPAAEIGQAKERLATLDDAIHAAYARWQELEAIVGSD